MEILKLLGEQVTPPAHTAGPSAPAAGLFGPSLAPQIPPIHVVTESLGVGSACGTAGTLFNLEAPANALPQNEESVDFFYNGVSSSADLTIQVANDYRGVLAVSPAAPSFDGVTGYYVNRATTGCKPTFEGALPPLTDPLDSMLTLGGQGDPIVVVNPANGNVYAFDLRFPGPLSPSTTTGVGISMTTKTNLLSTTNCPAGTHTPAQLMTCWPKGIVVGALPGYFFNFTDDKSGGTVDTRASGIGAGDVYATWTEFDSEFGFAFASRIMMVACNSTLKACSDPVVVSGILTDTQFSDARVRSDGTLGVTFVSYEPPLTLGGPPAAADIMYVACHPGGAPFSPSCSSPVKVFADAQQLFDNGLGSQDFRVFTYPKNAFRANTTTGFDEFVVWDRCGTALINGDLCPNSDIAMSVSTNGGATWSAAPITVDASTGNQFFPWVVLDPSTNIIDIDWLSSGGDAFNHRLQVKATQIPRAATVVNPPIVVNSTFDDPSADLFLGGTFFGDYIGMAAKGTGAAGLSRAYLGYTENLRQGTYNGASEPTQDNWMSQETY